MIRVTREPFRPRMVWVFAALFFLFSAGEWTSFTTQTGGIEALQKAFEQPPDESRIMMRWWWYGPSVTKAQLEREMRLMKAGGIGGIEVQPVYPLSPDDSTAGIKNLPFLSDEFLDALRFTADKSRELGLRLDLTLGSGWPFGGPTVPVNQAAGRLRVERLKVGEGQRRIPIPPISEGESLIAAFLGTRELTDFRDGALWLPEQPNSQTELRFFISSRTGQQVKRPAVGGEGFVIDHYDRAATDNYLKTVGDRLMQAFPTNKPYAVFCDSLEVFSSDWTPDFLAEFQRRRGYDLKPLLPALAADIGPKTADIRHDWAQTLTELLNERFLAPMRDWAKRNNTKFRIQGYGIPPMTVSGNAYADLPEGEGPQWKTLRASRWAASAGHIFGRNVTSSETWTWTHSPVFRSTPLDLKAEADLHFLQGINQLIGHGWPYTPPEVEYPGWRFYAAGVLNDKNPWWIVMPDLALYLQRLSFLMRQGQPANDVALYLPNSDGWVNFGNRRGYMIEALRDCIGDEVIARTLEAGYNLDFFDDEVLQQRGRVEKGALALGEGRYKVVILPNVERMPPASLKKLEEFARNGGKVIATRRLPAIAPGFKATEAETNELRATAKRMFEAANAPAHFVADENRDLAAKLHAVLQPDVMLSPAAPEIGFIRRHTEQAEIYFLANSANVRKAVKAKFRVAALQPESWNPFTGQVAPVQAQALEEGGVTINLELEPYESRVLAFTKRKLPGAPAKTSSPTNAAPAVALDLTADWQVTFGNAAPTKLDKLRSWADDEATRFFSGQATYEKTFFAPDGLFQSGQRISLDFGEAQPLPPIEMKAGMRAWLDPPVREAAVIYVNGRRAASVWCPPYSVEVTGLLQRGENRLKIIVANTALNYLSGRRLPDYKLLNLRYGLRFEAQDMDKVQALPSGLLGPVRLVSTAR